MNIHDVGGMRNPTVAVFFPNHSMPEHFVGPMNPHMPTTSIFAQWRGSSFGRNIKDGRQLSLDRMFGVGIVEYVLTPPRYV